MAVKKPVAKKAGSPAEAKKKAAGTSKMGKLAMGASILAAAKRVR